jgi:DNA polymerase V
MKLKEHNKVKESMQTEIIIPEINEKKNLNFYTSQIPAGFPSPAEDFMEKRLDLNEYLIKNQAATFLIKVNGNSMVNAGIFDGDILIIDRSLEAKDGKIVLGVLNGEFTIKRIRKKGKKLLLTPENENYNAIEITEEMDFQVWGVVTYSIHKT